MGSRKSYSFWLSVICSIAIAAAAYASQRETQLAGIQVGQTAEQVTKILGSPGQIELGREEAEVWWTFRQPSFNSTIVVYLRGGKSVVWEISAKGGPNPSIKTSRGVQLGDTLEKVTQLYGYSSDVKRTNDEVVVSYLDKYSAVFGFRNSKVSSITLIGNPNDVFAKIADSMVADAIKGGAKPAEAHFIAGLICKQSGAYEVALDLYSQGLKIDPSSFELTNNMGSTFSAMGDEKTALVWFTKAIALNPDSAEAQYNAGNSLAAIQNYPEAKKHLEKAVELAAGNSALKAQALMDLGSITDDEGQPEKAIGLYLQALAATSEKPILAKIWYNLGLTYRGQGNQTQAIGAFQKALVNDPEYLDAKAALESIKNEMIRGSGGDAEP
jgi:Tfp pilus assembly protein PilF